ncbi:GNAT family N-acetyltransferase [Paenibacillus qinlingensis]|uniref:GNAT family N-acetyltransferase n=1 Tax=Paenibacillus qinlingensis TaxID=1837343 RepID=UPI001565AC37|nr:GNAT family N-acetyltransferase [Paenibacillus qinlingensis]NQX59267.1 GNAT family N-acetyltransferase [Paenibacillus qinlingensis]
MTEIRRVRANEMEQAVRLSDETFRDASQKSMLKAFPNAFDSRLNQSFGAFENGELVAFMGLVPAVVHVSAAKLNVLSLGSVCTHPNYRGQKIASNMLQVVHTHAESVGASMLLVSGDGPLYMRSGCHYFGRVTRFEITNDQETYQRFIANPGIEIRRVHSEDWFRLHAAAESREVRYAQGVNELPILMDSEAIASCYHMHHAVYAAFESDRVAAYAIVAIPTQGRVAEEEAPFVVEWGGSSEALAAILQFALQEQELDVLEIPVMWNETRLLQVLSHFPSKRMRNHGTVHIVNPERLFNELLPYLSEKAPAAASRLLIRQASEDGAVLLLDGIAMASLTAQEVVDVWFDPEAELNVPKPLKDVLNQLFPVPFPHAGGLNFV